MQIKKVVTGVSLVILSVFLALMAFYQWEVKPELASRDEKVPIAEKKKEAAAKDADKPETRETLKIPINKEKKVESVKMPEVVKAEIAVPEEEISEKVDDTNEKAQGFLWINRKASKYVVTLGKKNGIAVGTTLLVYEEDKKIGKVEVDTVYDTIAYVHPIDIAAELSEGDYYRVVPQ